MPTLLQDWNDPATVASWTASDHPGNPGRQEHLAMLITLLGQVQPGGLRVLDIGCGDGVVAEVLLNQLPGSSVVGIDLSPPMLEAATRRLSACPDRWTLHRRALQDDSPLPEGGGAFDAAIAVQSVHHLNGAEKQAFFHWTARQIRPGGLFVLSDRINLPSAALFPYFQALYQARQAGYGGKPLPDGFGYGAHRRALELRGDLPDTVEDQLTWLRQAGFGEAACFARFVERAVFGGLKIPPLPPNQPQSEDHSAAAFQDMHAAGTVF